jgi:hypothetical protein
MFIFITFLFVCLFYFALNMKMLETISIYIIDFYLIFVSKHKADIDLADDDDNDENLARVEFSNKFRIKNHETKQTDIRIDSILPTYSIINE